MKKFPLNLEQIEYLLSAQGNFCLVDWLLHENQIDYAHYEAWRYGQETSLDTGIDASHQEINTLIKDTEELCASLGLSAQEQNYYPWLENQKNTIKVSGNIKIHNALSQQWLRPQDLPQMDLFMDNTEVITENTLLDALGARQFEHAQQQLKRLTELKPTHEKLGEYLDLVNYGKHMLANAAIDNGGVHDEFMGLQNEVIPLAKRVLKHNTRDYLAFAWRRMSNNLQQTPFDASQPMQHASYTLMQIPDWKAAYEHLQNDSALFNSPILLYRLAQCYEALQRENESLLIWCTLMELDSEFCEKAIEEKKSPYVWKLWQDFWEINESWPTTFFSSFILASNKGLIHYLDYIPPLQTPNHQAVISAIQTFQESGDKVLARKKLQEVSPALLRLYMSVES